MLTSTRPRVASLALLVSTILGTPTAGQGVVDQYQLDDPHAAPLFESPNQLTQTFTAGLDGTLAGVEVRLVILSTEPEPGLVQTGAAVALSAGRSDADGAFESTPLAPGRYRVQVRRAG